MKYIAAFAIPHACVVFFCFVVILAELAVPFISGFAVDSTGRLYVGENDKIAIYQSGRQVSSIALRSNTYEFTVDSGDHVLVAFPSSVYLMDFQGNVLYNWEDPHAEIYAQIQHSVRKYSSENGDRYNMKGLFGWTRIVKNDSEVVYRISVFSFVVKCLMILWVLSMTINVPWLVCRLRRYGK